MWHLLAWPLAASLPPAQLPAMPYRPRATPLLGGGRSRDLQDVVSCGACCYTVAAAENLDAFYAKQVMVGGFKVAGSERVSDAALLEAALTVGRLARSEATDDRRRSQCRFSLST